MPNKQRLQPNNNKQRIDPILRLSLHPANRLDLHHRRRVLKPLLPVLAPLAQYLREEEKYGQLSEGTFVCVFEWESVCY